MGEKCKSGKDILPAARCAGSRGDVFAWTGHGAACNRCKSVKFAQSIQSGNKKLQRLALHFNVMSGGSSIAPMKFLTMQPRISDGHVTRAFSLLEILIVVALIALISSLTLPALRQPSKGAAVAAYTLRDAFEEARVTAMARRTWVWVGIDADAAGIEPGSMRIGVVASKNGKAELTVGNLSPVLRLQTVENAGLAANGDGRFAGLEKIPPMTEDDKSLEGASFSWPGAGGVVFEHSVAFNPRGDAMVGSVPGDELARYIRVYLQPMRGSEPLVQSMDVAAVLLSGPGASVKVFQP